jgi:RNA polymerase sigma factor (sigma-70 family)
MLDWEQLITEHGPRVWRTAYRILANHADAMDCYQETFLAVHRNPPKSAVADWAAYLGALAARRAIDRLREIQRRRTLAKSLEVESPFANAGSDPEAEAVANELMDGIWLTLTELPDRQAKVFWLISIEWASQESVSEQFRITPAAVRMLLHRARAALRAALQINSLTRNKL